MDVSEFYKLIGEKQSIFGDSIFELIDIDNSGTLDFSEFVTAVGTFCMFGKIDVLKFCFYIFDKDKNGTYLCEAWRVVARLGRHPTRTDPVAVFFCSHVPPVDAM